MEANPSTWKKNHTRVVLLPPLKFNGIMTK